MMSQPYFVGIEHLHGSSVLTLAAISHGMLFAKALMLSSERLPLTHLQHGLSRSILAQEESKAPGLEVDPVMTVMAPKTLALPTRKHITIPESTPFISILLSSLHGLGTAQL